MGSIYGGIASVTEAAAVGVLGAIFVAAFRNSFDWNLLQVALAGTMSTVGTIIWLIFCHKLRYGGQIRSQCKRLQ